MLNGKRIKRTKAIGDKIEVVFEEYTSTGHRQREVLEKSEYLKNVKKVVNEKQTAV